MTVTHPQHQRDFDAGKDQTLAEILGMGFDAALSKWRMENPQGHKFSSLAAYYYAKGGLQALADKKLA
jgi:hypothetical protein